ncbi:hypothetical protein [Brevibacterium picturae]|uniref:Uncharacterized protein n=1 Tax=Brevibacterium picturae TaxID=260553 RepID=A0ABP4NPN6_9MICO
MTHLPLHIRSDVLDAATCELLGTETLDDMIEDTAYLEASNRDVDSRAAAPPIACTMTGPLVPVNVTISETPHRLLTDALRTRETLDGLVTALLIDEVRYRRTALHWLLTSADEPVMTNEIAAYEFFIRHPYTIVTTTGGHLMYTLTATVRTDVLAAFDATLDGWEDRSEEVAALVQLEDEVRDEGTSTADPNTEFGGLPTTTIEIQFDAHDHAALERVLGAGEEAGGLLTSLMLNAVNGACERPARANDPLPIPA